MSIIGLLPLEATTVDPTSFLATMTEIVSWGITNISAIVSQAILPNPFLWVPMLAFFIIGGCIGLTRRLMGM